MPELPEVETIRRDLEKLVLHKKISKVTVKLTRLVKNPINFFIKTLKNNKIKKIERVGKLLIFNLVTGHFLLVHLKMTGQLIYQDKKHKIAGGHSYKSDMLKYPNKYTYIILKFADGSNIYFNDMRTFGYMQIVDKQGLELVKEQFGLEPISKQANLKKWQDIFKNRKTNLKALLMNQRLIAGIGNIYADEICFAVKVSPQRPIGKLTQAEIKNLFAKSQQVLRKAISKRGTTFNNYVDSQGNKGNFTRFLKVYGRAGKLCPRCHKVKIIKLKHAGRGTHFCPNCQK